MPVTPTVKSIFRSFLRVWSVLFPVGFYSISSLGVLVASNNSMWSSHFFIWLSTSPLTLEIFNSSIIFHSSHSFPSLLPPTLPIQGLLKFLFQFTYDSSQLVGWGTTFNFTSTSWSVSSDRSWSSARTGYFSLSTYISETSCSCRHML
jgi:hypothetical protein